MKQLGAAESCCHGNHCRCMVQGIINPRFLEFMKKKINKEDRKRRQSEIKITNRGYCKHLKGGQNSIVKCDLSGRTLQGTKGFS